MVADLERRGIAEESDGALRCPGAAFGSGFVAWIPKRALAVKSQRWVLSRGPHAV
jgi:hypothetical protein